MSGFIAIPNEAAGVAECHDGFDLAVYRLYVHVDRMRWKPFPCADRWMQAKLGLSRRQCSVLLGALADAGCCEIVSHGDENEPRTVRFIRPKELDRDAERVPERVRSDHRSAKRSATQPEETSESDRSPERRPERVPERVIEAERSKEDILQSQPQTPASPGSAPVAPSRAATLAWDSEHRAAFGTEYPWRFKGRDPDGSKVSVWLSTARVDHATPGPGIERLRVAFAAYFAAVRNRTAYPRGDPATTKWFTNDVSKWLQTSPDEGGDVSDPQTWRDVEW